MDPRKIAALAQVIEILADRLRGDIETGDKILDRHLAIAASQIEDLAVPGIGCARHDGVLTLRL
ncbi:hypothetical protein GCM10023208_21490 [Erythrobacter westpacificensis]|uniref:Uncharacterized protein n=1 Tax=Erythrobacter westpacificensis TaxID=1055231 RepID=A0ABP9KDT2_9SPHN